MCIRRYISYTFIKGYNDAIEHNEMQRDEEEYIDGYKLGKIILRERESGSYYKKLLDKKREQ